jgi:hypothetical protein
VLRLELVAGDGQTASVHENLPELLVVQVVDGSGSPVEGALVHWRVLAPDDAGELATASMSNAMGLVEAQWTLGWRAGEHMAEAAIADDIDPVLFGATATGVPGVPSIVRVVSGDDQETTVGSIFPDPVVVEVRDAFDEPVVRTELVVTVQEGDGWIVDDHLVTSDEGAAEIEWIAGPHAGAVQALEARATPVTATARGMTIAATPGVSHWGHRDFVEYIPGELPVVITAPHGGVEEPDDVADRTYGTFVRDTNTSELSYAMADALEAHKGQRPHLVVVHLRRIKLDANRELEEAAQGDPLAIRAWHEYHLFIEAAKAKVEADWGAGFYFDIHGHGHTIQRLELGYSLTSSDLESTDAQLNEPWAVDKSSVRTLVAHSGNPHAALIRGASALGTLYESAGFASVPSSAQPDPGGAPYFNGGYNTRRHGCREGGTICGVQIEANFQGVRDSAASWAAFGEASVIVLDTFFEQHYGHALGHAPPSRGVEAM